MWGEGIVTLGVCAWEGGEPGWASGSPFWAPLASSVLQMLPLCPQHPGTPAGASPWAQLGSLELESASAPDPQEIRVHRKLGKHCATAVVTLALVGGGKSVP